MKETKTTALSVKKAVFPTMLLTFLYIVTGKIGLELAVPPGYATMIWPPSGIAVGMLLVYGWRLWPGILLGSFLLNYYISGSLNLSSGFQDIRNILPALAIAAGSTLQSLASWILVNRFIGLPLNFLRVWHVTLLFLLCGPMACMIAASIGTWALYTVGIIGVGDIAGNWLSWWFGDVFGVLVFTPLILLSPLGVRENLRWKGTILSSLPFLTILTIILPLGLTFYVWKITSEKSYVESTVKFNSLVQDSENALMSRMTSYSHALSGGLAFFQNVHFLTRKTWNSYASSIALRDNFPGINGIGVIYPVDRNALESFVASSRKDGAPEFKIGHQNTSETNYVIKYIYPEEDNNAAIGLNIAFEKKRKEAADLSRDTARPAITKKIVLVQDQKKSPGFLLLHPIYDPSLRRATMQQRRDAFRGWIYAPFIASKFFESLTEGQERYFHLRIYDGESEDPENLIYSSNSESPISPHPSFRVVKIIDVMQKKWLAVWESTKVYDRQAIRDEPIIVLVWGLSFTFMFSVLLMVFSVRRLKTLEMITRERAYLIPTIVFLMTCAGTASLYTVVLDKEEKYIADSVERQAESIASIISIDSREILLAMRRMGDRWTASNRTSIPLWNEDTKNYVNDFFSLNAIAWVDNTYHIRSIFPPSGYERQIGLSVADTQEKQNMLLKIEKSSKEYVSPPTELFNGEKGFLIYVPVTKDGHRDGLIVGIISIKKFFDLIMVRENIDQYSISVERNGEKIYEQKFISEIKKSEFQSRVSFSIGNEEYVLTMSPLQEYIDGIRGYLPLSIMISGLTIALLMAMVTRFILVASIRAAYLKNAINAADSANKAKSLFLSNISHEIRTPLNGILATTELLGKTPLDKNQKKYVDIVQNSGELLFNLLNDILDISKIEMKRLELHIAPFNIHSTISMTADLFVSAANKKGIEIDVSIPPELPMWVYGDRHRFTQILANLIGNAVKYTEKGRIFISASKTKNEEICLDVCDTGIGIPEASIDKIFDRFSQAHNMPKIAGTGLGLAICKSLVDMMGGEIGVQSKEHAGSTFWIKVPLKVVPADMLPVTAHSESKEQSHEKNYGQKILLVEDVDSNRDIISSMFTHLGCETDVAENGAVALDLCSHNKYDIIFMDCNMPIMDGYEASRRLRQTHGPDLPIIAISAHAFTEDIKKCYDAGMNDYVSKPVRIRDLENILQKYGFCNQTPDISEKVRIADDTPENIVVDLSLLKEWVGSDATKLSKIIRMTLENSRDLYRNIVDDYQSDDRESLRAGAHALKSVAAQVGGLSLSGICKDIEINALSLGRDALDQRMAVMDTAMKNFLGTLEKYQDQD